MLSESLGLFVVDRTVRGMTAEGLMEAQRLLHDAAGRATSAGEVVRYLRCTFIPEQQRCICLFQATDLGAVRKVNETAQVPFGRISAAIEFSQPGSGIPERGESMESELDLVPNASTPTRRGDPE